MLIVGEHKIKYQKLSDNLSNDELYEFCLLNSELHIERDAHQNIVIMAPVGGQSGFSEKKIGFWIEYWLINHQKGISFSPSTGFLLPNGAMRSPDGCWVSDERWAAVPDDKKEKFLPLVPDFVVEIRSRTDTLKQLQNKMTEWIENGVRLGWLIDKKSEQTFIYRADGTISKIVGFDNQLSGEDVMEGFEFDLKQLQMP